VRSLTLAGIGEQLLVDVQAAARDAVSQPVLTVTATYADAGEPPQMFLATSGTSPGVPCPFLSVYLLF
jgi:hypothetical protein